MGVHRRIVLALAAGIALCASRALAISGREALDQAKKLDDTTRHWSDRTQSMVLTISDSSGKQRSRELRVFTKRAGGGEEKAISFFSAPPEVKGTAFLQWTHPGRDDEQWLYLPEFKRTRQISARLRDESFVGTDFTFRDLEILAEISGWSEDDAAATLEGEETVDGALCHRISLRPHQEGMVYDRIVLWLDTAKLVARKIDFYGRDGALAKSLSLQDIRDVGPIPTAHHLEMRTLAKASRTVVDLPEVKFDSGLDDDLFTQRYLERGEP